jgi:hypothetical protein
MSNDLLKPLRTAAEVALRKDNEGLILRDRSLGPGIPWRPHLYEADEDRGWYLISEVPLEDIWQDIIQRAKVHKPTLNIGICAPNEMFRKGEIIRAIDSFDAQVLPFELNGADICFDAIRPSIADLVIERAWTLEHDLASSLLDRAWERASHFDDPHEKGRQLERVGRLLFSQVSGWRVQGRAFRRKNQEIDIVSHNEHVGGVLGRGAIVMGEAKNRVTKVDPDQYVAFRNKLRKTNGLAKIGFMISKAGFTDGAVTETIRDTESDTLIVLLNEAALLHIWRGHTSTTEGMAAVVMQAVQDQRQVRVDPDW